jgi:hypothetical protein
MNLAEKFNKAAMMEEAASEIPALGSIMDAVGARWVASS